MPEEITSSGLQEQNGDADAVVEAALHAELARALGVAHGDIALSQRFNHRKVIVPDVTSKFFLQAKGDGESWFVYLSPRSHPHAVEASFRRARSVADALSDSLAAHVMLPRWEGHLDGRSYAVSPKLEGITTNRVGRMIQRLRLAPMICDWIEGAVAETKRVVPSDRVIRPLEHMANMTELPDELRSAAAAAAREFGSGRLTAVHAINHRDLWSGNVLFRRAGIAGAPQSDFRLIDWGASTMDASPGYDLIAFARDVRVPAFFARRRCRNLARIIGCKPEDLRYHVTASVAALATELSEWPVAAFIKVAQKTMGYAGELLR